MPSNALTPTNLHMDLSVKVVIDSQAQPWIASAQPEVRRKPLARQGREGGHATSIVQYRAGASFPAHNHPGGEEIFVLEGTFSDENGDYPAGTYLRNPPNTRHAPFSKDGCLLFVKLHQFQPDDLTPLVLNTHQQSWRQGYGNLEVMPLHQCGTENVALVKWPAGEVFQPHTHFGGEEILVLSGIFRDEHGSYPTGTWIRSPHLSSHTPFVDLDTVIWVKTGHL
ncbi:cupin domain-containing protein [Simiduia curdlanivorans]|uniref:Cupin domain-containing protein n=1 Tax=Simiduia curdlanivorans TaxID=1492769 RepID=A0ABV8V743_9GAMM|nr:cupin domain-containing protein [Simiduia curdlanivorans]MDN3637446.1 cupin domain-containing protein [Simiduia curdlanivorans]